MKYLVALIGFVLVFVVTYLVVTVGLVFWHPKFLADHLPISVQGANNPIGVILALLAGISSARATLKSADRRGSGPSHQGRQGLPPWLGYSILAIVLIALFVLIAML